MSRDSFTLSDAEEVLSRTGMLKPGDQIVVAVSGGCDSSALLDVLVKLSEKWDFCLLCAHVNHNLRGSESKRDEDFVRAKCESYGVPFRLLSTDIVSYAFEHRLSTEEAGREVRYGFFESCAEEMGGAKIATAHTLSDSAETALFHLARGTSLAGLCGIPPVRGKIVRPLIEFSRKQTEGYCLENGVAFVTDSTNLTDDYARNRIRHNAVPVLEELNPAFSEAFLRTERSLSEIWDYLKDETESLLRKAMTETGFDTKILEEAPPALQKSAAAALLRRFCFEVSTERVEELAKRFGKSDFKLEWKKNSYLIQKNGFLTCREKKTKALPIPERAFSAGKIALSPEKTAEITLLSPKEWENSYKVHGFSLKNCFDYDKIIGKAVLRSRRAGDLADCHGGTKTLKKLFNEAKIPPEERNSVLVVSDDEGIVWVEGIGSAMRCRLSAETTLTAVIKTVDDKQKTVAEDAAK